MTQGRKAGGWKMPVTILAVVALLLGGGWYGWTNRESAQIARDQQRCFALAKEAALKRLRTTTGARFGGMEAQLNMMNATVSGFVDIQNGPDTVRNVFNVVFDGPSGGRRVESVRMERGFRIEK